ncbi:hypothetical protein [Kineosporia succinea]|uniref:Uncharacterized protein n=1 Tax=Kineosporia succinea TaxID=84632 RepID=A0ABT9P083_9ACTN|nr:hypothetical protein [Kineosporia succinea]MDP9826083.1 hypothetical protein [Kineosporia succinea]
MTSTGSGRSEPETVRPRPEAGAPDGAQVDHLPVGGFCACCGAVYPCSAARRQGRDQPRPREIRAPLSRLARLCDEMVVPAG